MPKGVTASGKTYLETPMGHWTSTELYVNDFCNAPGTVSKTDSATARKTTCLPTPPGASYNALSRNRASGDGRRCSRFYRDENPNTTNTTNGGPQQIFVRHRTHRV
ncbi:hypothetical protein NDU88_002657 [Pleurodeles waltl]|uniref:Uncharacterized protein n=1 Tax=Pleurodeles waltl TaxID=8319 RepID=A0AAV7WLT9_PLEWA|nr:hypothetical protein NDU88_002657 [Pleurodeles waltl]